MQSIVSRTYTNMALSAILLLLAILVLEPYLHATPAEAQALTTIPSKTNNPEVENAAATREVAAAIKEVASALREEVAAQKSIGSALLKLSTDAGSPTK